MRKLLVISITLAALTVNAAGAGARRARGGRDAPGRGDGREAQSGVVEDNGGIRYINPGSPTIPDADINSPPIPRMPTVTSI